MQPESYTASELAAIGLPGLPSTRQGIDLRAKRDAWTSIETTRSGSPARAYPLDTLPREAREALVAHRLSTPMNEDAIAASVEAAPVRAPKPPRARRSPDRDLDRTPDSHRAIASERLRIVNEIDACRTAGGRVVNAIEQAAIASGHPRNTVRDWYYLVRNAPRAEWFSLLLPRWEPHVAKAECDERAWQFFRDDYLRASKPAVKASYRRMVEVARAQGWSPIPSVWAFARRLNREVATTTRVLRREGVDAVERLYPAQKRDRTVFGALQAVCSDGHKFDVMVRWPSGQVTRPIIVGFQDLGSGKILSWRVDQTETMDLVRLAFADLVETFGIPDTAYVDNGRAFASKQLTGGTPNRYRFKLRAEDPEGIFNQLGVSVHFVRPYRGQSKPIERAWRDLVESIARHPACDGAYTGSDTSSKPHNYGARTVELGDFLTLVEAQVREHNAREGRTSGVCAGRSFDQVFAASYAESPIRKATEAQRRLLLLAAEGVRVRASDASIHFQGNRYWSEAIVAHRGESVIARFDPQHLHRGLHVYAADGTHIGLADCVDAVGFADTDAARTHARARTGFIKAIKRKAEAEQTFEAAELAAMHLQAQGAREAPTAKVVAPMFTKGRGKRDADRAFEPTPTERERQSRKAEADALVSAIGAEALSRAPRRKRPLAAGE